MFEKAYRDDVTAIDDSLKQMVWRIVVRYGELVFRSYPGWLPVYVLAASNPRVDADAEFPATFQIDEDGRLRSVEISGPFYRSKGTVDSTVSLDDYGTDKDIKKP